MRMIILSSGSDGNCIYIGEGGAGILIDAGISRRSVLSGLKKFGIEPSAIDAVFITHEHSDHCRGLHILSKYEGYPVFTAEGTAEKLFRSCPRADFRPIFIETRLKNLSVRTIPLPHDAVEPMGFIVENGSTRILVATDLGYVSDRILEEISRCSAVVLESLKQAAGGRLKLVALAHLSKENNHPRLALEESSPSIPKGVKLVAAERYSPTGPFDI